MRTLKELVTSKSELVTRNKLTSLEVRTRALKIAKGLTVTEPGNDLTGWYCLAFRKLGEAKYTAIANMARDPSVRKPKSVFGTNLKEELAALKSRQSSAQ